MGIMIYRFLIIESMHQPPFLGQEKPGESEHLSQLPLMAFSALYKENQ